MFDKKSTEVFARKAIVAQNLDNYNLVDTLECGQCFRFLKLTQSDGSSGAKESDSYVEYMTVIGEKLIFVGQRNTKELIFYDVTEREFSEICVPYFALDTDYAAIRENIILNTDSEFLKNAASAASGIRILRQDPWETLFSFIISQNNNIPRIKKIIRNICSRYGENLAQKQMLKICPKKCAELKNDDKNIDFEECRNCGVCFSFPSADSVNKEPDLLLDSNPGFRFKYLTDAAKRVASGEVDFEKIKLENSYEFTVDELMKIKGVGEKVASCTSLFAFSNLDAFPIDVWMKRAIDEYFDGKLDPKTLGKYAGVAQQYIFHYIRILSNVV